MHKSIHSVEVRLEEKKKEELNLDEKLIWKEQECEYLEEKMNKANQEHKDLELKLIEDATNSHIYETKIQELNQK